MYWFSINRNVLFLAVRGLLILKKMLLVHKSCSKFLGNWSEKDKLMSGRIHVFRGAWALYSHPPYLLFVQGWYRFLVHENWCKRERGGERKEKKRVRGRMHKAWCQISGKLVREFLNLRIAWCAKSLLLRKRPRGISGGMNSWGLRDLPYMYWDVYVHTYVWIYIYICV